MHFSCKNEVTKTLKFENCEVNYSFYLTGETVLYEGHTITNKWELESAKRKLAICLCEEYLQKPNERIKSKILEIYKADEEYYSSPKNFEFSQILEKRLEIFDPLILID